MSAADDSVRLASNWAKREKIDEAEAARRLDFLSKIKARRFDYASEPPKRKPRWMLAGKSIATPGNICVPQAQAGTGKSNFIGAFVAARAGAEQKSDGLDCLGLSADGDAKGVLLWIDTEQSHEDFDANVRRALRRGGLEWDPEWLQSYGLAGMSAAELRQALMTLLWSCELEGVYGVILDGVADLVADVNDAEECNAFVAELHGLAIKYDAPIIAVLHENAGAENGKGRGHLGSQLERKAETVLRLTRKDDITTIFSKKARKAMILEKDGPRFEWSDNASMHLSVASNGTTRQDAKTAELRELAVEVFGQVSELAYSDIRTGIERARGCATRTAERQLSSMKEAGVIRFSGAGKYLLAA